MGSIRTRGGEASGRAVLAAVGHARREGVDVAALLDRLPFGLDELRTRGFRVAWDDLLVFWARLEEALGGPAALERMGIETIRTSWAFQLVGRLFLSPRSLYLQVMPRLGRSLYSNIDMAARPLPDGRIEVLHRMHEGYTVPRSWGAATLGLLRGYPQILGLPVTEADMEWGPTLGRFLVSLPDAPPRHAALPPPAHPTGSEEDFDFAAEGELPHLLESRELHSRFAAAFARIAAAGTPAAIGEEVLSLFEREFFCRWGALRVTAPDGGLRLVAERRDSEPGGVVSRTLRSGARVLGRLELDAAAVPHDSLALQELEALLPQLEAALEARLAPEDAAEEKGAAYRLTARELEVLSWIREGRTNGEIATLLAISERTVHKHVEHLLEKLGVETRLAAARKVEGWRWTGEDGRG